MSSAQAWEIVLNCMQKANDGRITRIEAESYLTSILLASRS